MSQAVIVTCSDLFSVIQLTDVDPKNGAWLPRSDDKGFVPTKETGIEFERALYEVGSAGANIPPLINSATALEFMYQFCSWHVNQNSALEPAARRLASALREFEPWIDRHAYLSQLITQLRTRVPVRTLIYGRTNDDVSIATLALSSSAVHIATPADSIRLANSCWGIVVAVNMTPEQLAADMTLATVSAQHWICWQPK